ncbi:MAG TPA: hypothetical protein PKE21_08625 [Flavobacteriales bacterium]|nr:hypothetical protein [Flavobacteriales bacterium]HMR27526.1 hypothetical protein [Flavobacteriales bacterium]
MKTTLPVRLLLFVAFVVGTAIGARAQLYCNGEPITERPRYILVYPMPTKLGTRYEAGIDYGQDRKISLTYMLTSADGSTLQWRSAAHLLTWMDEQGWEYQGPAGMGGTGAHIFRRKD